MSNGRRVRRHGRRAPSWVAVAVAATVGLAAIGGCGSGVGSRETTSPPTSIRSVAQGDPSRTARPPTSHPAVAPAAVTPGCEEIESAAAGGHLRWSEAAGLLAAEPGCRLSTYATLVALLDEAPLTCEDVRWHAERSLVSPQQAGWLRDALAARARPCPTADEQVVFGTSVEGRPLVAWRRTGGPAPTRRVVAVGVVHGEEPAGRAVIDRLLGMPLPADLELWLVPSLNPDGEAVGRRGNAHGVDLNRNFPTAWAPPGSDPYTSGGYDSGPAPASEPEVQSVMALLRTIRPTLTLWYHQPWEVVICDLERSAPACQDYGARVGLGVERADRPGSAIGWQVAEGLGAALVVELADGPPAAEVAERHALAVLAG